MTQGELWETVNLGTDYKGSRGPAAGKTANAGALPPGLAPEPGAEAVE